MWYVIQVTAGTELVSSEKYRQTFPKGSGRRVFVPQYVCQKKYQGVWREERKVLIPGCFFLDTTNGQDTERKISGSLAEENHVSAVYPEEQAFLSSMFDENGMVQMSKGDIVDGCFQIKQGPLQQKEDRIRKMNRHKRMAEIELSLHGEHRRVLVGVEIVEKS